MPRFFRWIGIILIVLLLPVSAFASETFYGTVVCDTETSVSAPFGGILEGLTLRKGDLVHAGDLLCTIATTNVFSPVSGTVSAVFGAGGDSVEEVKARCGGVVYITPENRFTVSASSTGASKSPVNYISVGQKVWLQKGKNKNAVTGTGIVSSVSTDPEDVGSYTVEIENCPFSLSDKVEIYRNAEMKKDALLGSGKVQQTPPVIISGDGSILRVHVEPGSTVSRGTLLFETVSGTLREMKSGDNRIYAESDGIVASVEVGNGTPVDQNSTLITLYPLDMMRVCISVPETSLSNFPAGQPVNLTFGLDDEREGTVQSINYLAETSETASSGGYANYLVYIDFEQKENVRQGMFVTVDLP